MYMHISEMRSQSQSLMKFQDIDLTTQRHPALVQLETALLLKKPANAIHFIKSWAMRRLKEAGESEGQQEAVELTAHEKRKSVAQLQRRRGAIVMAKFEQTEHWKQFFLKEKLAKNEQCRSRIMIGLRSVPFLFRFEWEDINHLVELGEVREYYQNEIFVAKGQTIDRLYVLISGEIKRHNSEGPSQVFTQGSYLFAEALITNFKTSSTFTVVSEKAWICGIEAYVIHERLREVNRRREEYFERILMNVALFSCLDNEEMYKLILMIKELPPYKMDEIIIEKEDPVSRLYLVLKGEFSLCRKNLSGEITALQTFREGQFFDEEWIRSKTYSEVAVIARTDGILNYIERESIQEGIAKIDHLIMRKRMKKSK